MTLEDVGAVLINLENGEIPEIEGVFIPDWEVNYQNLMALIRNEWLYHLVVDTVLTIASDIGDTAPLSLGVSRAEDGTYFYRLCTDRSLANVPSKIKIDGHLVNVVVEVGF